MHQEVNNIKKKGSLIMNIFRTDNNHDFTEEMFEKILNGNDVMIERIISKGHITPEGDWYNQEKDEWVLLLQGNAVIQYEDLTETKMTKGDSLFIAAHQKHRVSYTSSDPHCIWLAVHGRLCSIK